MALCYATGQPVNGGTVFFSPAGQAGETITGKPATGNVGPDGTFTLTTYTDGDGAVVGKHTVSYAAVESDNPSAPKPPCAGAAPVELEINPGDNDLKVEL